MKPTTLMWINTKSSQRSSSHLRLLWSPENVFFSQLRAETSEKTLLWPQEPACMKIYLDGGENFHMKEGIDLRRNRRLQHDTNMKSTFMNMPGQGSPETLISTFANADLFCMQDKC